VTSPVRKRLEQEKHGKTMCAFPTGANNFQKYMQKMGTISSLAFPQKI
jgi:hypothetical protein